MRTSQDKWLSNTVADEVVGEEMFRVNATLALARCGKSQDLLVVALFFTLEVSIPAKLID